MTLLPKDTGHYLKKFVLNTTKKNKAILPILLKGVIYMRAKLNLKAVLDARSISIRQLEEMTGLKFETLRRLYNDDTKQYQRDTIGRICEVLGVEIGDILILENDKGDQ